MDILINSTMGILAQCTCTLKHHLDTASTVLFVSYCLVKLKKNEQYINPRHRDILCLLSYYFCYKGQSKTFQQSCLCFSGQLQHFIYFHHYYYFLQAPHPMWSLNSQSQNQEPQALTTKPARQPGVEFVLNNKNKMKQQLISPNSSVRAVAGLV